MALPALKSINRKKGTKKKNQKSFEVTLFVNKRMKLNIIGSLKVQKLASFSFFVEV